MKLLRLLANLGYGSRREVSELLRSGAVTDRAGEVLYGDDQIDPDQVLVEGEPLDPAPGVVIALHKPLGYTCSHKDQGRLIYSLLPPRFNQRKPQLSSVGRLDRDTSGLLLLTDDGQLLHRITAPKSGLAKVYRVLLDRPLRGDEAAIFASGTLLLESDDTPLRPAQLQTLSATEALLTLHEGRYHQARRMFAAVGNHVLALHRQQIGGLHLGDLREGAWRMLNGADLALLFGGHVSASKPDS